MANSRVPNERPRPANADVQFSLRGLFAMVTACALVAALATRLEAPIWFRAVVAVYFMVLVAYAVGRLPRLWDRPGSGLDLTQRKRRHVLSRARASRMRPYGQYRLLLVVAYGYLHIFIHIFGCASAWGWSHLRDFWSEASELGVSLRAMQDTIITMLIGLVVVDWFECVRIHRARNRSRWIAHGLAALLLVGLHFTIPPIKTPTDLATEYANVSVTLMGDGSCLIDEHAVAGERLIAELKTREREVEASSVGPGRLTVHIHFCRHVTVGQASRFLGQLRASGFRRITLLSEEWFQDIPWLWVVGTQPGPIDRGDPEGWDRLTVCLRADERGHPESFQLDDSEGVADYFGSRLREALAKAIRSGGHPRGPEALVSVEFRCDEHLLIDHVVEAFRGFLWQTDGRRIVLDPPIRHVSIIPMERTDPFVDEDAETPEWIPSSCPIHLTPPGLDDDSLPDAE